MKATATTTITYLLLISFILAQNCSIDNCERCSSEFTCLTCKEGFGLNTTRDQLCYDCSIIGCKTCKYINDYSRSFSCTSCPWYFSIQQKRFPDSDKNECVPGLTVFGLAVLLCLCCCASRSFCDCCRQCLQGWANNINTEEYRKHVAQVNALHDDLLIQQAQAMGANVVVVRK